MTYRTCFLFRTIRKRIICANGLGIVFNHIYIVFGCQCHDGFHITTLTKQMNRHYGFCFRCNGFFNQFSGNVKRVFIRINHYWSQTQQCNNLSRSHISKRGYNYFIPCLQLQSHHRNL